MSSTVTGTARHVVVGTGLGELTMVRDDDGLTGLYFPGHWTDPDTTTFGPRVEGGEDALLTAATVQLGEYLAGRRREFDLPLTPHGTDRARQGWRLLAAIPYGRTITYGALAEQLGNGINPRAVGGFVGHNPLSVFIACHRVIGAGGKLTGYAGGLERKRFLLELEGALPSGPPSLW